MPQVEIIPRNNAERLEFLKGQGVIFHDTLAAQIDELCEIQNPSLRDKADEMRLKKEAYQETYALRGVYCYIPWRQSCLRILEKDLLYELRTARNVNVVRKDEQKSLARSVVAIAGLSVGSNVARCSVLLGAQRLRIADKDRISPSNLNRMLCGVQDIGRLKVETLAEYLYEMDPFIDLFVSSHPISAGTLNQFIGEHEDTADIIIDEMDDLEAKILLRKKAAQCRIPLVSAIDNGDSVLVDVERYDRAYDINQFLKTLENAGLSSSAESARERAMSITRFIGPEDLETAVLESILDVGENIYSWPQLGTTAVLAGSAIVYCVRNIICNDILESGRYVISLPSSMGIEDSRSSLRPDLIKKMYERKNA